MESSGDQQRSGNQKKRQPNFSAAEVEVLISEVEKRKGILFSTLNPNVTKAMKDNEWKSVAAIMSRVTNISRKSHELITKWKNVKSSVKEGLSAKMTKNYMNGTGGGPTKPQLSSSDVRMLGIIGKESVVGIENGYDTSSNVSNSGGTTRWIHIDDFSSGLEDTMSSRSPPVLASTSVTVTPPSAPFTPVPSPTQSTSSTPSTSATVSKSAGQNINPKVKLSNNTKLLHLQQNILEELRTMKKINEDRKTLEALRLQVEKERLDLEKEKLELLKTLVQKGSNAMLMFE